MEMTVVTRDPCTGYELEKLKKFLQTEGLSYDEGISHTVLLLQEEEIIATGSCQRNMIKCVAVSDTFQGHNLLGTVLSELMSWMYAQGITHIFGFTKPKNKGVFGRCGLYPVTETADVLLLENRKKGFESYLSSLKAETEKQLKIKKENPDGKETAAIVANCNPFTLGHRYLLEQAAKASRLVHLFILSEEQPLFTARERYMLAEQSIGELQNVILHQTSDYLISPATFPTYFIKDKTKADEINCRLDIQLFAEAVAPCLGITKRYVGSEPVCQTTALYNRCLQEVLPAKGIQVQEVKRCEVNGRPISASLVRKAWMEHDLATVADMLPLSTYRFLEEKQS